MMRRLQFLAALYALGAIVTFGAAAEANQAWGERTQAECRADGGVGCYDPAVPPIAGLVGGLLWPLYWSWEAWS